MNKLLECTKGPWETRPAQLGQTDADSMRDRGIGAVIGDQNYCIAEAFWRVDQLTFTPVEANAALIAAAFDHALIWWADQNSLHFCVHANDRDGVHGFDFAEIDPDEPDSAQFVFLPADSFGFPILTDDLRDRLIAEMEGAK